MYQEIFGREIARGDIVAYPSGQHLDYAVITEIEQRMDEKDSPYELVNGHRLTVRAGVVNAKQFYMFSRWNRTLREREYKGFRMRRKNLTGRVLCKVSEGEFMHSLLSNEEKQIVLTYIQSLRQ